MARRKSAKERREALKRRQQQSVNDKDKVGLGKTSVLDTSKIENLNFFKPRHGRDKNTIDILPYEITTSWYKNLRTPQGRTTNLEEGDVDYKLELPIHRNVGPEKRIFICLRLAFGKRCPICEERSEEFDKPEEERNKEKIVELKPRWRNFYNVYDYDEQEKGIQLWDDMSYHMFEKYLLDEEPEITFSDLEDGRTLVVKFREKELGTIKFLEASSIEFTEREPYTEDVLDQVFNLDSMVHIPTFDEVLNAHLGMEEEPELDPNIEDDPLPDDEVDNPFREGEEQEIDEDINSCPSGLNFGKDFQNHDDCETCEVKFFEACSVEYDKVSEPGLNLNENQEILLGIQVVGQ